MPENFLEINRYFALTSYYNTIGQSNNAFSILEFLWRENKESMFCSFHPLADETKNEHLPKPFFKVIRKSLYIATTGLIQNFATVFKDFSRATLDFQGPATRDIIS